MGSRSGAALYQLGPIFLEITDTGLEVVYLKAEVVDGSLLGPDHLVHGIPAFIRAEAEELDQGIPNGEEADSHAVLFPLDHLIASPPR